jgi:hypothetical protein
MGVGYRETNTEKKKKLLLITEDNASSAWHMAAICNNIM